MCCCLRRLNVLQRAASQKQSLWGKQVELSIKQLHKQAVRAFGQLM